MSNYDWNDREDGWHAEQSASLTPVRAPNLEITPTCDGCEQTAERRILTSQGLLCQPCADRFVELQRFKALEAAKREVQRFRSIRAIVAMAREEE